MVCAIVQITYGPPENCGLCCPGWGTATAALSLGRRQTKPDKESRQKWRRQSGDGLGGQGQAGPARHTSCPEASTAHPLAFLHLALHSQVPAVPALFPPDVLNLLPCLNWRQLFFLLSRKGRNMPHSPSPPFLSSPSPRVEKLFISKQKVGLDDSFTQPFPSRNQVSQGSQPPFPVGGGWSSPQFSPPLFPYRHSPQKDSSKPHPPSEVLSSSQWEKKPLCPRSDVYL